MRGAKEKVKTKIAKWTIEFLQSLATVVVVIIIAFLIVYASIQFI